MEEVVVGVGMLCRGKSGQNGCRVEIGMDREKKGKYLKSWETTTTPPVKALIASAKLSIVGISKPFVGSSNNNIFGPSIANNANTILDFCPSDNVPIKAVCDSPLNPYLP